MSIEDQDSVDAIGVDEKGVVVLTISDHLEWNDKHLYLLQGKINTYLVFLESGQVHETYPNDKELKINMVCKYEPTPSAIEFISQCSNVINQAGFQFGHEVYI